MFTANYADIGIGVKGGISLFRSDDNRDLDFFDEYLLASNVSLSGEFDINCILAHDVMLTYFQAGGKTTMHQVGADFNLTESDVTANEKLDYLGIGYGLKLKVPMGKIIPYIVAGGSLDFLLHSKEELQFGQSVEEVHQFDESEYKKINVRPFISAGVEYKIFRIAIIGEYTFSYNLLPYYEHEKDQTNSGIKYTTYGHFVNLGCKVYL
jgi:hypothetical protein